MPYQSPSDAPSYVGESHKAQWIAVFNSAYKKIIDEGGDTAAAEKAGFKTANGVIKKAKASDTMEAETITPNLPVTANPDDMMGTDSQPSNDTTNDRKAGEPAEPIKPTDSNPTAAVTPDPITVMTTEVPEKLSAVAMGYMELAGATKDADCSKVEVAGGVSKEKGCCNGYLPVNNGADEFKCGECIFLTAAKPKASKELKELSTQAVALSEEMHKMPFAVLLSMDAAVTAIDGRDVQDIPVACTGTWVKGQEFSITPEDLDSIVQNFEKRLNNQVVIDYEHASEKPEVAAGQPIPAAGWIHGLSVKGNMLVARVEWTPQARNYIKNGQYRFFSPAINWGVKDKVSGDYQGATMTSGALTNHPFLEELPPILLSESMLIDVTSAHVPAAMGADAPQSTPAPAPTTESGVPVDSSVPVAPNGNPVVSAAEVAVIPAPSPVVSNTEVKADDKTAASEVCMADKQPYGDVPYADPGYQADKQKRYPIDTEEHIRAAWNYIHHKDNAGKYSPEHASAIKSKIVSAWKDKVDKGGPPKAEASEKTMKSTVKKIEDGKFAGRFGRFAEDGKLLNVMPTNMDEQAMSAFAAELDESDPVAGKAQPGPEHVEKEEAAVDPAGAFLADKTKNDNDADDKEQLTELSPTETLKLITFPAGSPKAGRVNLSEVTKLVNDGRIKPGTVFAAQAAEQAVSDAIAAGKFLPKQRPALMKHAMTDPKGFEELAASQPKQVILSTVGVNPSQETGAEDKTIAKINQLLTENKGNKDYGYRDAVLEASKSGWEEYRDATTIHGTARQLSEA